MRIFNFIVIYFILILIINCEEYKYISNILPEYPSNKVLPFCIFKSDCYFLNLKWKPYDQKIAFICYKYTQNGKDVICYIDPDGNNFEVIDMDYDGILKISSFDFNTNGDFIVFNDDFHLYIVSSKGGQYRMIYEDFQYNKNYSPIWSSDGEWIYFLRSNGYSSVIWKIRPDGTESSKVDIYTGDFGYINKIELSIDSKYLLMDCNDKNGSCGFYIVIVSVDDSKRWVVFKSEKLGNRGGPRMPCFSPDNNWVCFTDFIDLWIISSKGGRYLYKLDDSYNNNNLYPDWSHNGDWIVFTRYVGYPIYSNCIFKIKVPSEFLSG